MKIFTIKFSFLFLLFIPLQSHAKSRPVYIDKEIENASIISFAEIIDYQDKTLKLKLFSSNDTITCTMFSKISKINDYENNILTGLLPEIGETILAVIDKENNLSLVAKKTDDSTLRFWSPMQTGSLALFYFNDPVKPIPNESELDIQDSEYLTCWDGCLFPLDKLVMK